MSEYMTESEAKRSKRNIAAIQRYAITHECVFICTGCTPFNVSRMCAMA